MSGGNLTVEWIDQIKELCENEGSPSPIEMVDLSSGGENEAEDFFVNPPEDNTYQTKLSDTNIKIKAHQGNDQETNTLELNTEENFIDTQIDELIFNAAYFDENNEAQEYL